MGTTVQSVKSRKDFDKSAVVSGTRGLVRLGQLGFEPWNSGMEANVFKTPVRLD